MLQNDKFKLSNTNSTYTTKPNTVCNTKIRLTSQLLLCCLIFCANLAALWVIADAQCNVRWIVLYRNRHFIVISSLMGRWAIWSGKNKNSYTLFNFYYFNILDLVKIIWDPTSFFFSPFLVVCWVDQRENEWMNPDSLINFWTFVSITLK